MSREEYSKTINDNINDIDVSDNVITYVYNKMKELREENDVKNELCEENDVKNEKNARIQKIKYIETNINLISDAELANLNKTIITLIADEKINEKLFDKPFNWIHYLSESYKMACQINGAEPIRYSS